MDAILYWNDVALEANRISHTNGKMEQNGPTLGSRALAIVHLAMYDALAAVRNSVTAGAMPVYLPPATPFVVAPGASEDAAVAGAAHATLSVLFPSQQTFFTLKQSQQGLSGPGVGAGLDLGHQVARALLLHRAQDPDAKDTGYAPSLARGRHRVDPDNPGQGFHAPHYGARSTCFATKVRYGLDAPYPVSTLGSDPYERALKQVRGKGIAPRLMGTVTGTPRRAYEETLIGIYWAYDGAAGLGTPPRLYNQIVREVALHTVNPGLGTVNGIAENALLFAMVNTAMADAGILAWEQKYHWDLWRPVVGIREHDETMGPGGIGGGPFDSNSDPEWLPLGAPSSNAVLVEAPAPGSYPSGHSPTRIVKNATPAFPAYPSGHATFGAAALHVARMFYGTAPGDQSGDAHFSGRSFVSDELNGVTTDNTGTIRPRHARAFADGLWGMIVENGLSRVYLGVHWIFDAYGFENTPDLPMDLTQNIGGIPLGLNIAKDIWANKLVAANGAPPV